MPDTFMEQVEAFASMVLDARQERLRLEYPTSDQWEWETVNIKPRKLYTLVDVGSRHNMMGKYMIEHSTGIIHGIKGYGKIHRGHQYGTLGTIAEWDWSGYVGRRKPT